MVGPPRELLPTERMDSLSDDVAFEPAASVADASMDEREPRRFWELSGEVGAMFVGAEDGPMPIPPGARPKAGTESR